MLLDVTRPYVGERLEIRLPQYMIQWCDKQAEGAGMSRSRVVRSAVKSLMMLEEGVETVALAEKQDRWPPKPPVKSSVKRVRLTR